MTYWDTRLAVFDLETTGVDIDTSRIVSACIALLEPDGSLHSQWNWLADPEIEIPEGASAVHGISTERARAEGRTAETVVAEITATIRTLLGARHPARRLQRPLRPVAARPGMPPSPHRAPRLADAGHRPAGHRQGRRPLSQGKAHADRRRRGYGVNLDDAHDAAADAIAAGRVAQAIARAFPDEVDVPFADLHGRQQIWYAEQAASFQQYIREVKGDQEYVAESAWPLRPLDDPFLFEDTMPMPLPKPRPSATIPTFDFGETLAIEAPRAADWRTIPPKPIVVVEHTVIEESITIDVFDEPAVDHIVINTEVIDTVSTDAAPVDPIAMPTESFVEPLAPLTPRAPKPHIIRIAAAVVTDLAGRSLLVRKRGSSIFMQPGGKIESGESALSALTRELREELGLVVDPGETEYIGSYRAVAANEENTVVRAEVFFLTTPELPVAGAEIEEILWVERLDELSVEVAPLSRDSLLPLWASRRPTLF